LLELSNGEKIKVETIEVLIHTSTGMDGHKSFNRPIVSFFNFRWKQAAGKLVSFLMIAYALTALTLLLTGYIGTSTIFQVNL
jgi:hypothetical protein